MLRAGTAGVRSRCHAGKPQNAHESLYPLAVDLMPYAAQVYGYFAAAVERMPGVFGVDLTQQGQFQFVQLGGQARCIESGSVDTCQFALFGQRQGVLGVYPLPPVRYRLIPDFFLSQSSSILSRPISE